MFALIESCPDSRPGFGWTGKAVSLVIHSFLCAVAASLAHPEPQPDAVLRRDTTIFWVGEERHVAFGGAPRGEVSFPAPPHWRIVVPATIPVELPPPGASLPGMPEGVIVDSWPVPGFGLGSDSATGKPGYSGGGPLDERIADERPELLSHPPIEFPDALRQAGISGHVVVETVIDTLGRAERDMTRVTKSAQPMFDAEALSVVLGSVYRPGRVAGRAVRVRVQVPVNFEIR